MFQKDRPEKIKDAETIIGESIKVKGNFSGQGNVIVDGALEGSLKTKGGVMVGSKAKISANIEAQEIVVNGQINGNLTIKECLYVGKTAVITGDVECSQISIEKGGILNGRCSMGKLDKKIVADEPEISQK